METNLLSSQGRRVRYTFVRSPLGSSSGLDGHKKKLLRTLLGTSLCRDGRRRLITLRCSFPFAGSQKNFPTYS